jgi:hypothetical protein
MENLSGYTETQLLKMINDSKVNHENLKKEIINYTFQVDELEMTINNKINELSEIEKNYVVLIEELNNRQNGIR